MIAYKPGARIANCLCQRLHIEAQLKVSFSFSLQTGRGVKGLDIHFI